MLDREHSPIAYSALMYELTDAIEHLQKMVSNMNQDPEYSDEEFAVELGHIYAHLNRSWNTRDDTDSNPTDLEDRWEEISKFPTEIVICG